MAYKTKDELVTDLSTVLASAKPGKILASDLRGILSDFLDSYPNINGVAPNSGNVFPYSGLQHYWKFNEFGTSVSKNDSTGAATLTASNALAAPGKVVGESAILFRSDSLSKVSNPGVDVSVYADGFSACGWINRIQRTTDNTYDCIFGKYSAAGSSADQWFVFRENSNNGWYFTARQDDGSYIQSPTSPSSLGFSEPGRWQFVSFSCDYSINPKKYGLYINGIVISTGAFGAGRSLQSAATSKFSIGAYAVDGSAQIQHSNSMIGSVGIWNRPLTSGEINGLYNNGYGIAF